MKRLFLFAAAAVVLLSSCEKVEGEGPVISQVRNHQGITGIDLRASADVWYTYDTLTKVEVKAQQNVLDVLITEVTDNRLVIRYKNDVRVRTSEPVQVFISAPVMHTVRNSGSGDIRSTSPIHAVNMTMDISGSGNIILPEVHATLLETNISGSGNIKVMGGTAQKEKLKISGSGYVDAAGVSAQDCISIISGSGNIWTKTLQHLDVTISGSGSVYYRGNPLLSTSISGSGKVVPF